MFGPLGISELFFIFALALLIFGPRELPKIGRTIGKAMAEFRKASNELRRTLNTEMLEEELRQSDPRRVLSEAASDLRNSVEKAGTAEPDTSESNTGKANTAKPNTAKPDTVEPGRDAGQPAADSAAKPMTSQPSEPPSSAPEVRTPAGQMARGELPDSPETTAAGSAEAADGESELAAGTEEKL